MRLLKPVITFNLILFLGSTLSSCRLTTNSGTLDNIYQVTDIITGKDSNGKKGLIFTYYSNGKKFSQEYWKRGTLRSLTTLTPRLKLTHKNHKHHDHHKPHNPHKPHNLRWVPRWLPAPLWDVGPWDLGQWDLGTVRQLLKAPGVVCS